jgi:hypothetical protein
VAHRRADGEADEGIFRSDRHDSDQRVEGRARVQRLEKLGNLAAPEQRAGTAVTTCDIRFRSCRSWRYHSTIRDKAGASRAHDRQEGGRICRRFLTTQN